MDNRTAANINTLAHFCGVRDVENLDCRSLYSKCRLDRADVMVLFGGSILAGGDILASAIKDSLAACYIIVGGAGHTTETLRTRVREEYPFIETEGLAEAEIFQQYLQKIHGCSADFLETESTNCGNNITNLLHLLKAHQIPCRSIILCQDATMQRRMDATIRRYVADEMTIINYAAYSAEVVCDGERLAFAEDYHGMWNMERYVSLLMGEIPRLTDDANGYGPRGKQFIAHVDVPESVRAAFEDLGKSFGNLVRTADPRFATRVDSRRGSAPNDDKEFRDGFQMLRTAARDVLYLVEAGYSMKNTTTFVGNHYLLSERQRLALARAVASREKTALRKAKELSVADLSGATVHIDGFNTIIGLEVAFSGSVLLRCMDGAIRDLVGLRGTYRLIDKTDLAISAVRKVLVRNGVAKAEFYLDAPVSNSGRLKTRIAELFEDSGVELEFHVITDVDRVLMTKPCVITGDAIILDHCASWYNLMRDAIEAEMGEYPFVDFSDL